MLIRLTILQQSTVTAFLCLIFYTSILLIKMRVNPFTQCRSPIACLYQKSKSKSQENRIPLRSRSKSFKDFQVNMISQALNQRHILQKEYNNDNNKNMERERKHAQLFGLQYLDYHNSALPSAPKQSPPVISPDKPAPLQRRNSEMMSTMLNIRSQTMNAINSQRKMTYESNWNINDEVKDSQDSISSDHLVSQKVSSRNSLRTSSERKCSIFNDLAKGNEEYTDGIKRSRFVTNKNEKITNLDRVNQEYFDDSKSKKSSQKAGTTRYLKAPRF